MCATLLQPWLQMFYSQPAAWNQWLILCLQSSHRFNCWCGLNSSKYIHGFQKPATGDINDHIFIKFKIAEFFFINYFLEISAYQLWFALLLMINITAATGCVVAAGCRKTCSNLSLAFILKKLTFLDWSLLHECPNLANTLTIKYSNINF